MSWSFGRNRECHFTWQWWIQHQSDYRLELRWTNWISYVYWKQYTTDHSQNKFMSCLIFNLDWISNDRKSLNRVNYYHICIISYKDRGFPTLISIRPLLDESQRREIIAARSNVDGLLFICQIYLYLSVKCYRGYLSAFDPRDFIQWKVEKCHYLSEMKHC